MNKICPEIVAIGASTGGPSVVLQMLRAVPASSELSVIVIQHMQAAFVAGFVTWLSAELQRTVLLVEEGQVVSPGCLYVAGAQGNLNIDVSLRFHYSTPAPGQLYVPNIDHAFASLSALPVHGMAMLLTGMGEDGALGMKSLAEKRWQTFVQSPETCVVAGMPQAALRLSPRHSSLTPIELARVVHANSFIKTGRKHVQNK